VKKKQPDDTGGLWDAIHCLTCVYECHGVFLDCNAWTPDANKQRIARKVLRAEPKQPDVAKDLGVLDLKYVAMWLRKQGEINLSAEVAKAVSDIDDLQQTVSELQAKLKEGAE